MKNHSELLAHVSLYYDYAMNEVQEVELLRYLKQFPLDMVKRAYTRIKENEPHRFPFISIWKNHLEGTPQEHAEKAFLMASDAASRFGATKKVVFEDKKIHAAIVAIGGWDHFCFGENDPQWRHKNFCDAYKSIQTTDLMAVPDVLGTSELGSNTETAHILNVGSINIELSASQESVFKLKALERVELSQDGNEKSEFSFSDIISLINAKQKNNGD